MIVVEILWVIWWGPQMFVYICLKLKISFNGTNQEIYHVICVYFNQYCAVLPF
jgi:hypothetical protein